MNRTVNIISKNFGKFNRSDIQAYMALDGFEALKKALTMKPVEIISEVDKSQLKGRGGAGYPSGLKLEVTMKYESDKKYVICNADEGEPGTFKDRVMLENDPYSVIEGMIISAYIIGANEGYLYIREEYAYLHEMLLNVFQTMREANILGKNILNSGYDFDVQLFSGAGAYICGEGTSLIESMEGNSGRPRLKPPFESESGYLGKPTLINNVETFAALKSVMFFGADEILKYGTEKSKGTKFISICGNVKNPGAYEVPFGISLEEIIYDIGGGISDDRKLMFVQIGGSSGTIVPGNKVNIPYAYDELHSLGYSMGSGAVLVADDKTNMIEFLEAIQKFFLHESCGKCTPCREGNRQLLNIIRRIKNNTATKNDEANLFKIANIMKHASFCGLGKAAPTAILSALEFCPHEVFREVK